jgi:DNA repair photolyase
MDQPVKFYKHASTVTSQLYFCASPIRLDSYNRCQYGCTYCFSRRRAIDAANTGLGIANDEAFEQRLDRVGRGTLQSALDEFILRRVPIQLGGMQDPFPPMEESRGVTLRLLAVLKEHDYPTLISTKGGLFSKAEYLTLLREMNVHVRLSACGIAERFRADIEVGCSSFADTLLRIRMLRDANIPVSLRIQPVIPSFESDALEMATQAAAVGVQHVSFEYLKIPSEKLAVEIRRMSKVLGFDIWTEMQRRGIKRIGRDYTLVSDAKLPFLKSARQLCRGLGVRYGAGDTEFIHLSDGLGCCNGSSFFLRNANQFRCNFTGVLSNRMNDAKIRFRDLKPEWSPTKNVHGYLTTNSRGRDASLNYSSWMSLLAHRWNGDHGPYSPEFFSGVEWHGEWDQDRFKVYSYSNPFD